VKVAFRHFRIWLVVAAFLFERNAFAAEAHGAGHETGIPFSVVFSIINFTILVALLFYFLRKPAKEYFASRATLIRTRIQQAEELKSHAVKKYAEYEGRLKSIDRETQDLIANLKHDGELEKRRLLETAEKQSVQLRETQEKIIGQELRKAKEELKQEAINLASEMAEKLVRENMTPDDQNRLIGEYLERMEKLA